MRLLNSQTIAGKLTRMNIVVSATALLFAYVAFLGYDLYTLRSNLLTTLETEASIVGANSVSAIVFDDQQAAESTLSALKQTPQVEWAVIVGQDGSQFAAYTRDAAVKPALKDSLAPGESLRFWRIGSHFLIGSRIFLQGKAVGAVYMLAETTALAQSALQFVWLSASILLLCFVIALLVTAATRNLVTAPLSGLAETAQIVSRERDYSVRAAVPRTSDELALLVRSFNDMLEQIQLRDREVAQARDALEQRVQERTAELSAANKELEAFSYTVAHDLRGPLQHISNIAFLIQGMSAASNPEERELVGKLFEGSQRMSALIDDLLNLSRATSAPLRRTAVDLGHIARDILGGLQAEEPGRDVEIKIAKRALAIADEGLLRVVLQNLLGNAWKYTCKKAPAAIEFGVKEEPEGRVFFVCDNGAGFDAHYADRLFRPFQRLHSQSEFPGTGIGLATAARIIARHGGRIWAESTIDQGSTFYFTLSDSG